MSIRMCTRGDSAVIFGENRLIGMATEQPSESVGEAQSPEMDIEDESRGRVSQIENEGVAGGRSPEKPQSVPEEMVSIVQRMAADVNGGSGDDEAFMHRLNGEFEKIKDAGERSRIHGVLTEYLSRLTKGKWRLDLMSEGLLAIERDEAGSEEKEEKEKPRSVIAEILAFLIQFASKLRSGTGFDVMKYAENRNVRRQLRIIEGRMEAINAQLSRKDLSQQDRQELLRQNETLEQEYQKLEKQLREQEKQKRRDAKSGEQEEGAEESEGRTAGEGAGRGRRFPEVAPRSEAQRALMEYVERVEQGEEVDLEEFRELFLQVVSESSPEERRGGLREIAQGLNGLLMEMRAHFDEYYSSLPQGVQEQFSSSPEEAKEEVIASFKEAWRDLTAIVNSVLEEVGEEARLVMDGNGIISVSGRGSAGSSERPGTASNASAEGASAGGPSGSSVEQNVTVNVDAEHPQESQVPAAQAQEAPEYRLEDLDTNALRSYLQSIGYLGDFAVRGNELVISGIRGGSECEAIRSFMKGFPEGTKRRMTAESWGSTGTYEVRITLTSKALGHICNLPEPSAERRSALERPAGDYVEFIPATEFHRNGMVPITVPANIMKRIGMGERERVILIKQVSKGKFEVPRYLGDARELPSFSPERWSTEPSADQVIAERLGLKIEHSSGGAAIIIPEKWVWSSAEGSYNDGPPMVVNGAKVVGTDLRNSPYYFG
ncbi:MAG TPA: hypothetical protein VJB10_02165 [Candidatus Peribacteraceae bacterium]|nr:hypothetical protein [Candidatus Peribacteraceae bacterium]